MGSKFESGSLLTKKEEMDMLYLQALCGSAIADWTEDLKAVLTYILKLLGLMWGESGNKKNINMQVTCVQCQCEGCAVVQILLELWESSDSERDCETHFLSLQEIMKDKGERQAHLFVKFTPKDWRETDREGRETHIRRLAMEIFKEIFNLPGRHICEAVRIFGKIFQYHWSWGTKFNFLYNHPVAVKKLEKEKISLIDAGLLMNSAYPVVLHPKRKVDLILSFDFSAGDPFLASYNRLLI
ncbi:cytosolic phospholipase A2 gamma-like [Acipenser ruthenus]|uniref:cytosolic phospholipase A2 gamma-like n=1 Tax=Acipenser ruthenus TaxID=7906 RepID=UPI002741C5CD|nr:cytosolic phospholipase A2 gamma-like [Acipenser ruthenus]